ncbi:PPC domain-containing protein [Lignipirellula cremea]|uniref:Uncharacterized protein n=1 Tax=Lignipirellula cremea TaxID=2528010 RepID=A0A518DP19_9BACT|nr:PPC domain-containing protein [Lignipirellula cremea]QDU93587.1 hypothetical protein Pla8534_13670 [Lignipirellula cremea]
MPRLSRLLAVGSLALLLAPAAQAQSTYSMLMSLSPTAAQTGQASKLTLNSRYSMHDAHQVLVSGDGVVGQIVPPPVDEKADPDKTPNLEKIQVRFVIADDALPGVRDFRIITPRGASTLGQLVVTREPVIAEAKKNNTLEEAQAVVVPATLCGVIEAAEDVDFFKFHAQAGDALTFHVLSMRLQNKIHDLQTHSDPILTLRNGAGVTLAASDNAFDGDPYLSHAFQQDGDYYLEIRDVRYQGNKYWEYAIEVSDKPFVRHAFPLGVAAGAKTTLQLTGDNLPSETAVIEPAADLPSGPLWAPLALGDQESNPAPLLVTHLPLFQESNGDNNLAETAEAITIPAGVNGRLETESDIDCFAFDAKKGESFSFEVIARRMQSGIDAHLRILTAEGKQATLNDDMKLFLRTSSDSQIENWTAPADGRFVVEVRDLHLRGGEPFVYFLQATRSEPYFDLYADTDKTHISPGMPGILFVRIDRKNGFQGEVQLQVDGLPPEVTAACGRILPSGVDGCIVLQAGPKASADAANLIIRGVGQIEVEAASTDDKSKDKDGDDQTAAAMEVRELTAVAHVYQETYQPGGGRGHWPVETHTVSVGEPNDIRGIHLSTTEVVLSPGESQTIEVAIERAEGFDKNVSLDMLSRHLNKVFGDSLPKGVTVEAGPSKTLLTAGAATGSIVLKAADNAEPAERQMAAVMANVSLNFVMKATYASEPVFITVKPIPDPEPAAKP